MFETGKLILLTTLTPAALALASDMEATSPQRESAGKVNEASRPPSTDITSAARDTHPNGFTNYDEISGVIVDRTVTKLGDQFYTLFSQQVNEQFPDLKENFTVKEIPTALSGSIIEVYHARRAIYRTALSPGRRQAKERAQEATRVINNYVVRWQAERLLQDTFDLDHDEF